MFIPILILIAFVIVIAVIASWARRSSPNGRGDVVGGDSCYPYHATVWNHHPQDAGGHHDCGHDGGGGDCGGGADGGGGDGGGD